MKRLSLAAVSLIALMAAPVLAQTAPVRIDQNAVEAHMGFLAGPELRGRAAPPTMRRSPPPMSPPSSASPA